MNHPIENDLRLIEAGFPCHQVGVETQRERGARSALPPLYFLHVWWARRPLAPGKAHNDQYGVKVGIDQNRQD